jgi:hypothetical protein
MRHSLQSVSEGKPGSLYNCPISLQGDRKVIITNELSREACYRSRRNHLHSYDKAISVKLSPIGAQLSSAHPTNDPKTDPLYYQNPNVGCAPLLSAPIGLHHSILTPTSVRLCDCPVSRPRGIASKLNELKIKELPYSFLFLDVSFDLIRPEKLTKRSESIFLESRNTPSCLLHVVCRHPSHNTPHSALLRGFRFAPGEGTRMGSKRISETHFNTSFLCASLVYKFRCTCPLSPPG